MNRVSSEKGSLENLRRDKKVREQATIRKMNPRERDLHDYDDCYYRSIS